MPKVWAITFSSHGVKCVCVCNAEEDAERLFEKMASTEVTYATHNARVESFEVYDASVGGMRGIPPVTVTASALAGASNPLEEG